jgi:radical SAM protein with 4Fe4S-binding SPASM domain
VEAALRNLRAAGYQGKLEIFTTVTRPAIPLLGEMRDRVSKWRVPYWRLALAMPIGRASRRPDLVPGPDEFRAVLAFIRDSREDGLVPLPELGEEGYLGEEFEGKVRPYLCQCRAGITIAGILCDGKIGACPELGEAFIQGDIRRERFREVWENRYQVFRDRGWTKKGACAECEVYSRCRGGSLHLYPDPGRDFLRCAYQMLKENPGR